jgi:hypothetical protein
VAADGKGKDKKPLEALPGKRNNMKKEKNIVPCHCMAWCMHACSMHGIRAWTGA